MSRVTGRAEQRTGPERLGWAFAAALTLFTGHANAQAPLEARTLTIPKETHLPALVVGRTWQRLLVVDLPVNGGAAESFVIDTGLNANAIEPTAYVRLRLSSIPHLARLDALDAHLEATEVKLGSLRIGAAVVNDVTAVLAGVPELLSSETRPDAPIGWLGTPFLSAFTLTVDYGSSIVLLGPADQPLPVGKDSVVAPIELREGRPYVRVTIPGARSFLALLDSGSPGTLIPTSAGVDAKVHVVKQVDTRRPGQTAMKTALGVAPVFRVGKAEVKNFPVAFASPDSSTDSIHTMAVLGSDFLRHFRVTISYSKLKVVFQPLTTTPVAAPATKG